MPPFDPPRCLSPMCHSRLQQLLDGQERQDKILEDIHEWAFSMDPEKPGMALWRDRIDRTGKLVKWLAVLVIGWIGKDTVMWILSWKKGS